MTRIGVNDVRVVVVRRAAIFGGDASLRAAYCRYCMGVSGRRKTVREKRRGVIKTHLC